MADDSGFNTFNNDGSFMESFMKMQEGKKPESSPKPKPLPPVRKPVLMKVSKIKKAPVLVKPAATTALLEGRTAQPKPMENRKGEMSQPSSSFREFLMLSYHGFVSSPITRT